MKALAISLMLFLAMAFVKCQEPATRSVDVALKIVDANGNVVANRSATFTIVGPEAEDPRPAPITATTDSNGIAAFKTRSGVYRIEVSVPGIGYGSTGVIEFVPGKPAKPHLPQLAPFGSISGKLLPGLCGEKAKVFVRYYFQDQKKFSVIPGRDGAFHFDNLEAGNWAIWADTSVGNRCAEPANEAELAPGQHMNDVILVAPPDYSAQIAKLAAENSRPEQVITWVRGKVSDEQGLPIANATVYALVTYFLGIRNYEETRQASTDLHGYYEFKGKDSYMNFSLTLVVKARGRTPAWAWPEVKMHNSFEPHPSDGKRSAPAEQDFVLSSRSGKLDVTVLQAGKPVMGANVAVYLANAHLRDEWAAPIGDRSGIEDAAYPVAITDGHGVAHFDNLLPGMYGAIATLGSKRDIRAEALGYGNLADAEKPYAFAHGIAVQTGETTKFRLAIYPQNTHAEVVIRRPDGMPLTGDANVNFGRIESAGSSTGIDLDSSGKGSEDFQRPGLWRVEVTYRDAPAKFFPLPLPYYAAIGEVAVSPSLRVTTPPVITARRFNGASVNVQVLDENGKPLHATVEIGHGQTGIWGSTDQQGRIRFEDVTPSEHYVIRAFSDGEKPLFHYGRTFSPTANQSRLENHLEILPQELDVEPNEEVNIVLKSELVGYLYGTLKLPAGQKDLRYVRIGSRPQLGDFDYSVFDDSGEYFAGPFHAGAVELWFRSDNPDYPMSSGEIRTTILPGEAKRVNIERADWKVSPSLTHTTNALMVTVGGASMQTLGAPNLTGKVTMHDGHTAAFGAQVFYFEPGLDGPTIIAMADAIGNLRPRNMRRNANAAPGGRKPGPDSPVLIVLLPGMCGATIQPAPKPGDAPLHLVLPQPLSLTGNVSLDRSALRPGSGSIRVIAAYQGESFLAPWVSMEAHADADGNFALKGLTPGTYKIQAALDEIWLSAPVTVRIGDRDPEPVHLAITAPGAALRIQLRGEDNKPVAGAAITIDHEGPLSGLWPHEWLSDGAGVVFVPTLESGKHTIRSKRLAKAEEIDVPPVRTATPVELVLTLR